MMSHFGSSKLSSERSSDDLHPAVNLILTSLQWGASLTKRWNHYVQASPFVFAIFSDSQWLSLQAFVSFPPIFSDHDDCILSQGSPNQLAVQPVLVKKFPRWFGISSSIPMAVVHPRPAWPLGSTAFVKSKCPTLDTYLNSSFFELSITGNMPTFCFSWSDFTPGQLDR